MTDEKVKALREKIIGQLAATSLGTGSDYVQLNWSEGRQVLALQAERDKLAGEVVNAVNHGQMFKRSRDLERRRADAAEAKLAALVEALQRISEVAGTRGALGFNIEGRLDHCRDIAIEALAHHSAPVGCPHHGFAPDPCCPQCPARPSTPTSAPVEDVGGMTADDLERLRRLIGRQRLTSHCGEGTFERRERERQNEFIDRILAALAAPALIQPQGEERS